jgi:predicted PurR-regulated permease PerM
MSTEWSKPTKYIVAVGLLLLGFFVLYILRPVITLLIIAALIAFLLTPIVNFIHIQLRVPRTGAVLLAYLLLILLILLSPLLFLPPIIDGYNAIAAIDYQLAFNRAISWFQDTLLYLDTVEPHIFGVPIDLSRVTSPALQALQNAGSNPVTLPPAETLFNSLNSAVTLTFDVATSVAGTVFSGFLGIVFTFFYAVYMSLDSHKFGPRFLGLLPEPYRPEIGQLLIRLRRMWRAYFRGQLNLMFIIAVLIWIGGTILGLPGAFALAMIAGLMEIIPGLGPFLAAIPAVLVALIQGSTYLDVSHMTFALIIIGFYWGVQQIENNFIVPRVLGEAVELHPLVVMIGVVVGASVGGILGALLAAPVIASAREVTSYLYAKILGEEPFPPQPEEPVEIKSSWLQQARAILAKVQQVRFRQKSS